MARMARTTDVKHNDMTHLVLRLDGDGELVVGDGVLMARPHQRVIWQATKLLM